MFRTYWLSIPVIEKLSRNTANSSMCTVHSMAHVVARGNFEVFVPQVCTDWEEFWYGVFDHISLLLVQGIGCAAPNTENFAQFHDFTEYSVLWRCWLSSRKGIRPVKTEWLGIGMVICLELGANDVHMVQLMPLPPIISCFIKIQNGLPFWWWLTQVFLEKKATKWM